MENIILTPELLQALNKLVPMARGDSGDVLHDDGSLSYADQMAVFAREFDHRNPAGAIPGLNLDAGPRWNFAMPGFTHFDSAESIFVARMLEYIRPGVYAKKYPQLKWQQLMPVNTSVNTGAAAYTVTGSDYAGNVTIAKMPSTNVNMVNQRVFQSTMGFFSMMLGYQFNLQEVREAIFANQPLQTTMAMNCRNVMERKLDDIAFLGEKTAGVKGLLTLSGTLTYPTPATGGGGSKAWEDKTPAQIHQDLVGPIDKMIIDSNEVEIPDSYLLPTSRRRIISTLRIGDGSDLTVEQFFLKSQEFVKNLTTTYKSEAAPNSEWTGKRAVVYRNDPEVLEMIITQPFEQMPPVAEHFTVTTVCHLRTGGLGLHLPKAVEYVDEI